MKRSLLKYLLSLLLLTIIPIGTIVTQTEYAASASSIQVIEPSEPSMEGVYIFDKENFKGNCKKLLLNNEKLKLNGNSKYVLSIQIKGNYKIILQNNKGNKLLEVQSRMDGTTREIPSTLTKAQDLYPKCYYDHIRTDIGRWFIEHRAIKSKRYIPDVYYKVERVDSYDKHEGVYLYTDIGCIGGKSYIPPTDTSTYVILPTGGGNNDEDDKGVVKKRSVLRNELESLEILGDYKVTLYRSSKDPNDCIVIYTDGRYEKDIDGKPGKDKYTWAEDNLNLGSSYAVKVERYPHTTDNGIYFYSGENQTGNMSILYLQDSDFVYKTAQFDSSNIGTLGNKVQSAKIIGYYKLIFNGSKVNNINESTRRIAADSFVEGTLNTNIKAKDYNGRQIKEGILIPRYISSLSGTGMANKVLSFTIEKIVEPKEEGVYFYDYKDCIYDYYDVQDNKGATKVKVPLGYSSYIDWGANFSNTGEYDIKSKASSIEIIGNYALYVSNGANGYGTGTRETDPNMPIRWSDPISIVPIDKSKPDFLLNLENHRGGMDNIVASAWVRILNIK